MSSQTTVRQTSSTPTLRVSTRQLVDAAYRALRVAGVISGVAAEAARDVAFLEHRQAKGVDLLEQILRVGPPLLAVRCEAGGRGTDVDAHGASGLLLAAPLVALVCDQAPSPLTIRRLAHPVALEPALLRPACAHGWRLVLTASDGTSVLTVDGDRSVAGAAFSTTCAEPLNVRLVGDCSSGSAPFPPPALPRDGLIVGAEGWARLQRRAAGYLV